VAASDDWTLSYRELMDEGDEQRLEILELPPDPQRQSPMLVADFPKSKATPNGEAGSDGTGSEKRSALSLLKECLEEEFLQRQAIQRESEELTAWLSRFAYSYHVSDYAVDKATGSQRMWISGRAHLECTSNGNLTGSLCLGIPVDDPLQMRVFGRPLRYQDGNVWHLQWRTVDQVAQSGTTNLVVYRAALKDGDVLVGSWVGRSSWLPDEIRPSGGPFVLHTQPNLSARRLRQIVEEHQELCIPNIREVAGDVVPLIAPSQQADSALPSPSKPRLGKPR
jgi:hypothetical protein